MYKKIPDDKLSGSSVYTAPKTAAARSQTALLPLENRSSIMLVAHGSVTTNIRRSWYDRLSGNIAAS